VFQSPLRGSHPNSAAIEKVASRGPNSRLRAESYRSSLVAGSCYDRVFIIISYTYIILYNKSTLSWHLELSGVTDVVL